MIEKKTLTIWAFGDAHVATDLKHGRHSMKEGIEESEQIGWDIGINVGDMSGSQGLPDDEEGRLVAGSYAWLTKHKREDIYDVCGNHDRSGLHEPKNWWFQKWVDPMGEHTPSSGVDGAKRPYKVKGTWERYSFEIGNILFLMMSDINEPSQKRGRGEFGGNPGGVVSGETFSWWRSMVEENRGKIIVSVHHYMLKDTTVASGEYEGLQKDENGKYKSYYHGYFPQSTPKGTSYLYWVDGKEDALAFESYLAANPGAVALWLGGHTHTVPWDTRGGKSHVEKKWGTVFVNVAALSKHHAYLTTYPISRLLTFTEGSTVLRIRCLDHGDRKAVLDEYERNVDIGIPFSW